MTPSASAAYTYHQDGRLRRATGAWGEVEWTYDAVGNRVLEEAFSGGSFLNSATYNYPGGSNKLSNTVSDLSAPLSTFTHTPDGNVASETAGGTATAYTYSEASRLAAITRNSTLEAEFAYDAFERRVRRSTASGVSHFVFLPDGRLIGEYDGATGAVIKEYVWMDDRLVGQVDASGTLQYIQTGPLGQPLIVTDAGGSAAWRGELSPFGELVTSTGTGPVPDARFLGQWDEASSGLYQNWHRTYDASLGRYLEADPIGLAAGQSLYGYTGQDPGNAVDADGLFMAPAPKSRSKTGGKLFGGGLIGGGALLLADYLGGINKFQDWAEDLFDPNEGDQLCPKPKKSPPQGFDRGQPPFRPPFIPIDPVGGPRGDDEDDDDCAKQWRDAYEYCATISPKNPKTREIWGGSLQSCVKGQVAQRCGGNRVEH